MIFIKTYSEEILTKYRIRKEAIENKGTVEDEALNGTDSISKEQQISIYNLELSLIGDSVASKGVSITSKNLCKRFVEKVYKKLLSFVCRDFFAALNNFQQGIVNILKINRDFITIQNEESEKTKELLAEKQLCIDSMQREINNLTQRIEMLEKVINNNTKLNVLEEEGIAKK